MEKKEDVFGFSRREFIKTTGLIGGAVLIGVSPWDALVAEAAVEPMDAATLAEQDKLYPLAKKEGEVTLYQSSSTQAGVALARAFMKKYPGVKCNVYRGGSTKVHVKFDTERRAGKDICDVLHSSLYPAFIQYRKEGVLMKYASPQAKYYRKDWTDPEYYAPVRFTTMAIAWNTDLVKDAEAPKTWAETAEICKDKKWFGKVSIGDPHGGATSLTQLYSFTTKWGDKAWDWWKAYGEANAGTFASHGAMDKEMMAGKYPLSFEQLDYRLNESMEKKLPVNAHYPSEGVAVAPGPAAINAKAPHPNAAKLLYNYFLSSEGCQAFQQGGFSNTARTTGALKWHFLPGMSELNIIDIDYVRMEKDMKGVLKKFDEVFGKAREKARA